MARFELPGTCIFVDIDKNYSIEVKCREKYEVVAVKRDKLGNFEERTLSEHILECDAENKAELIKKILEGE